MQHGSLAIVSRKEGPAVWQFRWSEKDMHGARVQRKRVIGSIERYQDEAAARSAMALLLAELNSGKVRIGSSSITVAQLCDHFPQGSPSIRPYGVTKKPAILFGDKRADR
jgi:integrase